MEASTQTLLIDQVREHLKTLPVPDRVRESIYSHFLSQCNQHEITEDEFYKQILKSAFRQAEPAPEDDPDPLNRKGTFVKIFGVTLHSLKRLGAVLFEDPARNKIYLEDVTFLKAHVDGLEDADRAIEYADLYKTENDTEKRYLKICYRLNPALPYRIDQELFTDLNELLLAGFKSRPMMNKIYQDYGNGRLHIWLNARDPEIFPPLPADKTVLSFLTFIYRVNAEYPFYIGQELFSSAAELAVKAQKDLDFWEKLIKHSNNGNLFTWFDARGNLKWRAQWQAISADVLQDALIEEDEKGYAAVQQLLLLIAPDTIRPQMKASETKIELQDLPATQTVEIKVQLTLKTSGFVKARVELDAAHDGIWLSKTQVMLFDLTGQEQDILTLYVDPQQLDKNTEYQTILRITSPYETLNIPVILKTVFPIRAFFNHVVKYALFGGVFFGFFRWFLSECAGHTGSLAPAIITTSISQSLPENYPAFFWVFVLLLASFVLSVRTIKKIEKI